MHRKGILGKNGPKKRSLEKINHRSPRQFWLNQLRIRPRNSQKCYDRSPLSRISAKNREKLDRPNPWNAPWNAQNREKLDSPDKIMCHYSGKWVAEDLQNPKKNGYPIPL